MTDALSLSLYEVVHRAPYRLVSDALEIRCYRPEDVSQFRELVERNREHLRPFMEWIDSFSGNDQELLDLLLGFRGRCDLAQDYTFGIFHRDDDRFIGGTGLHPRVGPNALEIGYWIGHPYVRRGYASQVVRMLTRVALERMGAARVEIHIHTDNLASMGVPEPQGFRREGLRRSRLWLRGQPCDSIAFVMVPEDLPGSAVAAQPLEAFDAGGAPYTGVRLNGLLGDASPESPAQTELHSDGGS